MLLAGQVSKQVYTDMHMAILPCRGPGEAGLRHWPVTVFQGIPEGLTP